MFIQIEITTLCNFRCIYCASPKSQGRSMSMALFDALLQKLPIGQHVVSLQGEGEPLVHPKFFSLAAKVWQAGHIPYVITNGSLAKSRNLPTVFPMIGISLDTVDADEAERVGRRQLSRVLSNVEHIAAVAGPDRVSIHTVDMGQSLESLRKYLGRLGIKRHIVQPLQTKADYRRNYSIPISIPATSGRPRPCRYITQPNVRFFNIDGIGMPCAYIKDANEFQSIQVMQEEFAVGKVPVVCAGCREIEWASQ
ncbi:radical SAM protein [Denitratisoma sp. DHT3]|uniref:radical SAM protein n=1 Tax=Denitratisoma sp. DHT3 TaxID=1981880 RepID=UPI001645B1D3|nr:radical SAM protein [Denitratisoma sp. DHT3]